MVNLNIVNDAYPKHRIDEQQEVMAGCVVFTTLYLTKGYHQLILHPKLKPISDFSTPDGLLQLKVLPKEMNTSCAVFRRVMEHILGDLEPRCVSVKIEDIIITSPSTEQHIDDLNEVFYRLEMANLNISVDKTKLAQLEVLVLGHLVNANGILPNPQKISILQWIARLSSLKEVRRFLGAFNVYKRFVPACSSIEEGLMDLTRGKGKKFFEWGEAQENSIKALLQELYEAPVLSSLTDGNVFY